LNKIVTTCSRRECALKRFITYLYQYEQGEKTINVGFIRVDIRDSQANMEVCVRNLSRFYEIGKIYALVNSHGLLGIELGEMKILNGQGNTRIIVDAEDIRESGYAIDDVLGIGIDFENKGYAASCWKDEYSDVIGKGEISIRPWIPPQLKKLEPEVVENEPLPASITSYRKIELNQIHNLSSKNWYLCNNSFLIHGFWNYGYLVLKKEVEENKEKVSLGIPGIFEKPEMVMAVLFGFPDFEALPEEIKEIEMNVEREFSNIKKNQEPKSGTFGCWYVSLQE